MARRFYVYALAALAAGANGAARADDGTTLNGLTFYGTIDVGVIAPCMTESSCMGFF